MFSTVSLVMLSLLALLSTSLATCTVGTMKSADFASLPCAINRCRPNNDGRVTLFLKGEFQMTDLRFATPMIKDAHEYYLLAYDWTERPRFVGGMVPLEVPAQLTALAFNGVAFDYRGGNCEMTSGPLKHTQLAVTACVFENGTCDHVWQVNGLSGVNTISYNRASDISGVFLRANVGDGVVVTGNELTSSETEADDFVHVFDAAAQRGIALIDELFGDIDAKSKL